MREEEDEEERWEVGDLFLPQYLTRLSSAWNSMTAGFRGNRARSRTRTYRPKVPHAVEEN